MATHPLRTIPRRIFRMRGRQLSLHAGPDTPLMTPRAVEVRPVAIAPFDRMTLPAARCPAITANAAPDPLIATFAGPP